MPYQLIVSFFEVSFNDTSDLRACSPFSLNVPSRKRVSSIFFNPFYTFPAAYHFVSSGSSLFPTTHFVVNTFKVMLLHLTYFVSTSLCTGDGTRGGSRTAATSKMERFVLIVNSWKPLTIITKRSILEVVAVLDPPLGTLFICAPHITYTGSSFTLLFLPFAPVMRILTILS